jgi:hypothetical protein
MKSNSYPTLSTGSFLTSFLLYTIAIIQGDIEAVKFYATNIILMARKGFGTAGATTGTAAHAKALLIVIILVLLIPAVALIFTGPTTAGTQGVYGNATVAAAARQGVVQFSGFIGIAMILGVVGVIVALV